MDTIRTDERGFGRNKKKKMRRPNKEDNDGDPDPASPADKLCEDELLVIFENICIFTKDLLNFRLVSKRWCDAATRTLLQRDACCITLGMNAPNPKCKHGDIDNANNCYKFVSRFAKFGHQTESTNSLKKLTTLLSNSPKFPTSNIRFLTGCSSSMHYRNYRDLSLFFELHGAKIKTLRPCGPLSKENLLDICFNFTPQLDCLDLSMVSLVPSDGKTDAGDSSKTSGSSASQNPRFKSITCGFLSEGDAETYSETVYQWLFSHSDLNSLENVNVYTLPLVIQERKCHLISGLVFVPNCSVPNLVSEASFLKQLSELNPKLSKLTLELVVNPGVNRTIFTSANAIIKSSKDTIQELKITIKPCNPYIKLKIPSMKKLKSVEVNGSPVAPTETEGDGRPSIFVLEDQQVSPEKYFPSLVKVTLYNQNLLTSDNPTWFFSISSGQDNVWPKVNVKECVLSKVEFLHIGYSSLPAISDANKISHVFTNVRILKISWAWKVADILNSSLWALCPAVEYMEIYGTSEKYSDAKEPRPEYTTSSMMDAFFTGFSPGLCRKLADKGLPQFMDSPEGIEFLRTEPSVCDLKCLKELKLSLYKRNYNEFASHVTGAYAFSKMPNTKFFISFDPKEFFAVRGFGFDSIREMEESCFASIKPYAQIVYEKSSYVLYS